MPVLGLHTLNEELLQKSVLPEYHEKGFHLYRTGVPVLLELNTQRALYSVRDRHPYKVEITVSEKFLYLKCDCQHASTGRICEHDVAAFFSLREYYRQKLPPKWRKQIQALVDITQKPARLKKPVPYFLIFKLTPNPFDLSVQWRIIPSTLTLSSLPGEFPKIAAKFDPSELSRVYAAIPQISKNIKTPASTISQESCINLNPEMVLLANWLIERNRSPNWNYSSDYPLDDCLIMLGRSGSPVYLTYGQDIITLLSVHPGDNHVQLILDQVPEGMSLSSQISLGMNDLSQLKIPLEEPLMVSRNPTWLIQDNYLLRIANQLHSDILLNFIEDNNIVIPEKDEQDFLDQYLLPLTNMLTLEGNALRHATVDAPLIPRIYLTEKDQTISAALRFAYGEYEIIPQKEEQAQWAQINLKTRTLVFINRKISQEEKYLSSLQSAKLGLKRKNIGDPGYYSLSPRLHPVDFLIYQVPRLAALGFEIYGEETLKTSRVNRNRPTISINISSGIDWFEVIPHVKYGEVEVEIPDLRHALQKHERFVKLADGSIGELPEEWIDRYRHLFTISEQADNGLRISNRHVTVFDDLPVDDILDLDQSYSQRRSILQHLHNIRSGIEINRDLSSASGDLRPYQKAGIEWLHALHDLQMGGCLADDMGLGKTIQTLVFLQTLKANGSKTHSANLLVVPRSLLINWQREAERFTPDIKILEYFDARQKVDLTRFDEFDIVITSYGILLRDIQRLKNYLFWYVILDESQAIKNPLSQTARAARLLKTEHRLCLTGTPVENSTIELWSQFSFLNPGLLGSLEYFKREIALPIEKNGDQEEITRLRKLVAPFILRRTKDQVAPELPLRTERLLFVDMLPTQRKMYEKVREQYGALVNGLADEQSFNQNRMQVLEGLLRLRQIANHPRLFESQYRGGSGKFELIEETLATLQAEGHRALVFSQFVQMLRIVRESLDNTGTPYAYLDGSTKNRQGQVDTFQSDPAIPFFLVSLKAGGKGLNLTAADYVIHIDPWWNPAVEDQASDRAHRIGQDKPVFIYKLITRNSVEEKIIKLQERKKSLVSQVIISDSTFYKKITLDEILDLFT